MLQQVSDFELEVFKIKQPLSHLAEFVVVLNLLIDLEQTAGNANQQGVVIGERWEGTKVVGGSDEKIDFGFNLVRFNATADKVSFADCPAFGHNQVGNFREKLRSDHGHPD